MPSQRRAACQCVPIHQRSILTIWIDHDMQRRGHQRLIWESQQLILHSISASKLLTLHLFFRFFRSVAITTFLRIDKRRRFYPPPFIFRFTTSTLASCASALLDSFWCRYLIASTFAASNRIRWGVHFLLACVIYQRSLNRCVVWFSLAVFHFLDVAYKSI